MVQCTRLTLGKSVGLWWSVKTFRRMVGNSRNERVGLRYDDQGRVASGDAGNEGGGLTIDRVESRVVIRFYAVLNRFLPPDVRQAAIEYDLDRRASVKDLIESLGVPHTEVDLVTVHGTPVDFAYLVRAGDQIGVYPPFASLDVDATISLRPPPPRPPRFLLDVHLGRLAGYLRLLGFDTRYRNDYDDETLARLAGEEQRILLTRDRQLLMRSAVVHGGHVWETNPEQQLAEVVARFNLAGEASPFHRCMRCNDLLEPVAKASIVERLEPKTRLHYDEFHRCRGCDRIYWPGSHHERLRRMVGRHGVRTIER
jgi:uncharacterized protein